MLKARPHLNIVGRSVLSAFISVKASSIIIVHF